MKHTGMLFKDIIWKTRMIQNVSRIYLKRRHVVLIVLIPVVFGCTVWQLPPGSIQAALGICSLAGHLVSCKLPKLRCRRGPSRPLNCATSTKHASYANIFPLKERRMLPVIEKIWSYHVVKKIRICIYIYVFTHTHTYIYICVWKI